jgi:hypothetical protein
VGAGGGKFAPPCKRLLDTLAGVSSQSFSHSLASVVCDKLSDCHKAARRFTFWSNVTHFLYLAYFYILRLKFIYENNPQL